MGNGKNEGITTGRPLTGTRFPDGNGFSGFNKDRPLGRPRGRAG